MTVKKVSVVYRFDKGLYINLTNRCPNACSFCVKREWHMDYYGNNLDFRDGDEPSADEVSRLVSEEWGRKSFGELVFCGYGEPTMRLNEILSVAGDIRSGRTSVPKDIKIRLNTNGMANAVWNKDTAPLLKGLVDSVNISLNSYDPKQWLALMNPAPQYRVHGFEKVIEFIRSAVKNIPDVQLSVITENGVDIGRFRDFAASLGAKTRVRKMLRVSDNKTLQIV